jgi:hypothetical protein
LLIVLAGFNAPLKFLKGFTAEGIYLPPAYRRKAINGGAPTNKRAEPSGSALLYFINLCRYFYFLVI